MPDRGRHDCPPPERRTRAKRETGSPKKMGRTPTPNKQLTTQIIRKMQVFLRMIIGLSP